MDLFINIIEITSLIAQSGLIYAVWGGVTLKKLAKLFEGLFDDSSFYKKLITIALPIVIQNFISSFLNMIDTVMIGKVGETEIAAVGIANQYFFFYMIISMSIMSGCGIFISQFWGKKDVINIKRVLGLGLISGLICSILFIIPALTIPGKIIALFNTDPRVIELGAKYLKIACLTYLFTSITFSYSFSLRSIGNTMPSMVISFIALCCNAVFNYILIFGKFGAPVMGVEGAAIATLIARVVETASTLWYIYSKNNVLSASIREMIGFTWEFVLKAYKTILPVMLNDAFWGLASVIYSVVYGRMGTKAIASIQICNNITNLFMVVIFGMSSASAVMIGNKIGAGEEEAGMEYARRFSALSLMAGIILGGTLALSAPYMLKVFNVSKEVLHDSLMILYITSILFVIKVFNIIFIVGVLRGGGDARFALVAESITMWCIGVPLTFIGAFLLKLPVYYVVALTSIEEITKFIICITRVKSAKWIRNVIHNMA